jgi:fatty acid desaturase
MKDQQNDETQIVGANEEYPEADALSTSRWKSFAAEIDGLGRKIRQSAGVEDFAEFRRMEFWGRCASAIGYATAWIIPNPISAYLISQGNFTRWSIVLHQVSHGAFDRMPNVPERYKSAYFGKGYRRFLDWFDWITPRNWSDEHNKLHHYHLGSPRDPDVVWRNATFIHNIQAPLLIRYLISALIALVWKPVYYAVNTLAESRHQRGLLATNSIGWNNWSPLTPEGRELWLVCLLPYAAFRFLLLPALFLPLGKAAFLSVLVNSVLAELFTNLHSFMTIAPNHTGDDLYSFEETSSGRAEYFLRQILGTVNYPSGGCFVDFLYGGMNYQIEHHLWPEATVLQCRRIRPHLKTICARYGVRYLEAPMLSRVRKTIEIMAGASRQVEIPKRVRAA